MRDSNSSIDTSLQPTAAPTERRGSKREITAPVSAGSEHAFKAWCAVAETAAETVGASMIPVLAKQARERFQLRMLLEREPPAKVEIHCLGKTCMKFDGHEAERFIEELDVTQNVLRSRGNNVARDDIALTTVVRAVGAAELGLD
jgi:hypothetical protein